MGVVKIKETKTLIFTSFLLIITIALRYKKIIKILTTMTAILLISCTQQYSKTDGKITAKNVIDVDLKTEDNINIKATFYKGDKEMPSIILLHMLDRDRNDWNEFAIQLQSLGYNVISIDLRGHGESSLSWSSSSDTDFNKMTLDVKAAKNFLVSNDIGSDIVIIGASIGANVALNYAVKDNSIKTIILLSPGLSYRGVKTEETIKLFKHPILIVAAEGDTYSADSSRALNSLSKNSVLKIYQGLEHGTSLFGKTDIDKIIIDWLKDNLKDN